MKTKRKNSLWQHDYLGNCPDENQPNSRDKNCMACRVIMEHEELVAAIAPPEVTASLAEVEALGPGITSDEGQRAYTETEMQAAIEAERKRVLRALNKALGGPGWHWLPETRHKLIKRVRKVASKKEVAHA